MTRVVIRRPQVSRLVTEEDELLSRISVCVELSQERLGARECLITANRSEKGLVQEKLGNLHKLARFGEVLFIGHEKTELTIWLSIKGSCFYILDKNAIAADEVGILGKPALTNRGGDSVKHLPISRNLSITLICAACGLDESIHPGRDPGVRPRLQPRTRRSVNTMPGENQTEGDAACKKQTRLACRLN